MSSGGQGAAGATTGAGTAGSSGSGGKTNGTAGAAGGGTGTGNSGGTGASTGNSSGTGTGNSGGTGAGTGNSSGTGTGNSGGTGNGGGTGGGGAAGSGLSRGPTPPTNGAQFPFPQNRQLTGCIYPAGYDNDDVVAAYTQWQHDLITSNGAGGFQRVQRTSSDGVNTNTPLNSTVSEGIGYGMLITVYMGDPASHALFDNLWKYEQIHLDGSGLMNWSIDSTGNTTTAGGKTVGANGATDADEDMAFALVMADKQWGSGGALDYVSLAKAQISAIWNHEIYQSKLAGPGDGWGTTTDLFNDINISYFAPAYYRVFKTVDPDTTHAWDAVTQTVFDTIALALTSNGNASNGLVPGWCSTTSTSCVSSTAGPFYYQYDACRTPFRLGVDWCWNGSRDATSAAAAINPSRAQAYVAKTSSFFSGLGGAKNIADGYNLDGSANPAHTTGQSAAFVGPAGVGAMSNTAYQSFLDDAYADVKTGQLTVGGAYYDESWTVMSLLMMTGNFLDYTALSPAQ
jgi:endo-1,4-beta-D-glucanase Y